jgi:hypothetical protein
MEYIGFIQKRGNATSVAVKYSELSAGTVQAGDIVLVQLIIESAGVTITPPGAYAVVGSETHVEGESQGYYWSRYAEGTEHTFTWGLAREYGLIVSVVRGCKATGSPIDTFIQSSGEGNTGTVGATSPAITTTHTNELVFFGLFNGNGWVWNVPATYTDATPGHNPVCAKLFYKNLATPSSTGEPTGITGTSGTAKWGTMLLALSSPPKVAELSAALSFTGAAVRGTSHSMAASLSSAGSVARATRRPLSAGIAFAGNVSRRTGRALSAGLPLAGALAKNTRKVHAGTLSFAGTVPRRTRRALAASVGFAGTTSRKTTRGLSASIGLAGITNRGIARALSGALTLSAGIAKTVGLSLRSALAFVASIATRSNEPEISLVTISEPAGPVVIVTEEDGPLVR